MKTSQIDSGPRPGFAGLRLLAAYLVAGAALLALDCGLASVARAAGNLMVTPTRVVFEQRTRTAQVTLVNQGSETTDFRISFIRQNMLENGDFVAVPEAADGMFSDTMVRYSPRQVRLPPGQSQIIRLMLRKPRDLDDGEYRSHMLFQALPPASSSSVEKIAGDQPADGITIELIPIVGLSIPVIVRHGNLDSRVSLSEARLLPPADANSAPAISLVINRSGTASAYGDLRAMFTPAGGQPLVVGQANSVAVYANLDRRRFVLPLRLPPGYSLNNGTLDIVFVEAGAEVESSTVARTRIVLN